MKLAVLIKELSLGQKLEIWSSEGGFNLVFEGYVNSLNPDTLTIDNKIKLITSSKDDQIIIIL